MESFEISITWIIVFVVIIAMVAVVSIAIIIAIKYDGTKQKRENAEQIKPPELPVMTQFDYGKMQLDYIDQVVNALIEVKIANFVILNQPYPTLHIDDDIKELATATKKALQNKFFDESKSMFTNEFLFKYIVEKCKIGLIAASRREQ